MSLVKVVVDLQTMEEVEVGGGGYFGGGGGSERRRNMASSGESADYRYYGAGGGGGSGYIGGVSDGTMSNGVNPGNGKATITLIE